MGWIILLVLTLVVFGALAWLGKLRERLMK